MVNLNELADFIYRKRCEFEDSVKSEAKKLRLIEIVELISSNTEIAKDIAFRLEYRFKYGEIIPFHISEFEISISSDNLKLYKCDMPLKEFGGSKVRGLYNKLADEISKQIQRYSEDLPF